METDNEFYVDLVLANAIRLIKQNGSTTTLDIKNTLREKYDLINIDNIILKSNITQSIVSDAMFILADNYFTYIDNGKFRIYKLKENEEDIKENKEDLTVNLSIAEAMPIINDLNEGQLISMTFKKKDDSIRTIHCTILSPNLGLGMIKVYDNNLPFGSNIRTIDLRRLISFELDNISYIID